MIRIHFDAARTEATRLALVTGSPVPPPDGGCDLNSLIALAGTCVALARLYAIKEFIDEPWEAREAQHEKLQENLELAVAWYASVLTTNELSQFKWADIFISDGRFRQLKGTKFDGTEETWPMDPYG